MAAPHALEEFTIDAATWTSRTAPFDCDYLRFQNLGAVDVKARLSQGDATSEFTIAQVTAY